MNFYPIFKKELKSYFSSLVAYIVLAVFLVISGYYFYTDLALFVLWGGSSTQEGLWQYLFHDIRLILLLTIPLLTMRLFAEEKKLGTIELLFTYPLPGQRDPAGEVSGLPGGVHPDDRTDHSLSHPSGNGLRG